MIKKFYWFREVDTTTINCSLIVYLVIFGSVSLGITISLHVCSTYVITCDYLLLVENLLIRKMTEKDERIKEKVQISSESHRELLSNIYYFLI